MDAYTYFFSWRWDIVHARDTQDIFVILCTSLLLINFTLLTNECGHFSDLVMWQIDSLQACNQVHWLWNYYSKQRMECFFGLFQISLILQKVFKTSICRFSYNKYHPLNLFASELEKKHFFFLRGRDVGDSVKTF